MALFVRQDENRSELQQRLATELQDRAKKKAEEAERPDGVTDSQYLKGTKEGSSLLWVWLVIGALVVVVAIFLIVKTSA
jgi:type VI protein secretion system component VasF